MVGDLFLEVIRAFYSYCGDALGSDLKLSYTQSGNSLVRYGFAPSFMLLPCCFPCCLLEIIGAENMGTQGITPAMKITDALESVTMNGLFPIGWRQRHVS